VAEATPLLLHAPEHDAGFHFNRLAVPQVRPELPLLQAIGDGFCLIGKRAEEMDVFYPASFIDDDPDRNRIGPMLVKTGSTRSITFSSRA